jgi:hypothetical protein
LATEITSLYENRAGLIDALSSAPPFDGTRTIAEIICGVR